MLARIYFQTSRNSLRSQRSSVLGEFSSIAILCRYGSAWKRPSETTFRCFSSSSPDHRCYNVAIVGSGPSGCYTAKYLLSAFDKQRKFDVKIDMLERLPIPYGLVRYGVAPDHPEVKNVENDFAALFQNNPDRIHFWGNVPVGEPDKGVSWMELRELYDAVVLAYGCESDRKLGIPGEAELSGVISAREFVAWYNGHPHYEHIGDQVAAALNLEDGSKGNVVVVGQGNVALDCARILTKGSKGLEETDIASRALPVIGEDGVPSVTVVGRRGHIQGAFTIKELRELTKLEEEGHGTKFIVREDELDLGKTEESEEELAHRSGRPKVRIDKLLYRAALNWSEDSDRDGDHKEVCLRFLLSPKSFEAREEDPSLVGSVVCERTMLTGEVGEQVAIGIGEMETIPAHLVLVSIGYKGVPLPHLERWFDEKRGVLIHKGGKVHEGNLDMGGMYVSGWLKRGPSGIIGTNIMDAKDTVISIVHDLTHSSHDAVPVRDEAASQRLLDLLKQRTVPVVRWSDFEKIDAVETSPAQKRNNRQPREKITDIKALLEAAEVS